MLEQQITSALEQVLELAKAGGASQCEVGASQSEGLSINVRLGSVETLEKERDKSIGITVYRGQSKGSVSTSDLSPQSLAESVDKALSIAKRTAADDCAGLADAALMATDLPDLDLYHPWDIDAETAIDLAIRCEAQARELPEITNSEGAGVGTQKGYYGYANSHGFLAVSRGSHHSINCTVVAGEGDTMQRDMWYSSSRVPQALDSAERVGKIAAERAIKRLNPRQIKTGKYPVMFEPRMTRSLLGTLVSAISGSTLYRGASFLLDSEGEQLFPSFVQIDELPLLPRGMGSSAFDSDGLARRSRRLVADGVLTGYVLSAYSARKLGMTPTATAGGVRNLTLSPGVDDFQGMLRLMGNGLLVTETMGQGANLATGDFSSGASGYWVENGEIAYPVAEVTIAGNMKEVFRQIVAVGADLDVRSGTRCGSVLLDGITVAGC